MSIGKCNLDAHGDKPLLSLTLKGNFMAKSNKTFKVGRDAKTGQFIPVKEAEQRKKTAVVETIKKVSSH